MLERVLAHLRHQHPKREHVARHGFRHSALTLPIPLMITGQGKQLGRHIPSRAHAIEIGWIAREDGEVGEDDGEAEVAEEGVAGGGDEDVVLRAGLVGATVR